eukprot:6461378-Amphidinium_carterae.4
MSTIALLFQAKFASVNAIARLMQLAALVESRLRICKPPSTHQPSLEVLCLMDVDVEAMEI